MWWCIFTRKNETHGSRDSIRVHVCIKLVCACFVKLTCRTTSYYRIHMNTRDPIKTVFDREKNQWLTDISSWDGNTEYIFKLAHIHTNTHTSCILYHIEEENIFMHLQTKHFSLIHPLRRKLFFYVLQMEQTYYGAHSLMSWFSLKTVFSSFFSTTCSYEICCGITHLKYQYNFTQAA